MVSKVKIAEELAEMIKEVNSSTREGKEKIPNSETHLKEWCSHFAMDEKSIRGILDDLKNAHYIFIINIVMPDPNLYLPGTDSYIYAEISLVNELKRYSENRLEKIYEQTFYKKKSPFLIIKELFPRVKEFNNTPIGKALNETVMIEEFLRVMNSSPYEYTDSWKKAKLREIYNETDTEVPELEKELELKNNRAVDQLGDQYNNLDSQSSQWKKLTSTLPIEFLVRIHFRKHEFDIVKKLIQTGKITEEKDLKYIRDTLQMMEGRANQDIILRKYLDQMVELRRLAQAKLNILRAKTKKS